ncbi:hypothetical protein NPIL_604641 [Nephila pilipes]|uniref:Uncharacterized protein n=1 Tax=Nephila pilipes TaxID=299642 RepID=A0A8X6M8C7_NEPPI|nr:hypothetical protein NPIL_604641 [Nephila pilipes]
MYFAKFFTKPITIFPKNIKAKLGAIFNFLTTISCVIFPDPPLSTSYQSKYPASMWMKCSIVKTADNHSMSNLTQWSPCPKSLSGVFRIHPVDDPIPKACVYWPRLKRQPASIFR